MGVFIQNQSKCKDTQFRMEVAWEKERTEHRRLMDEAQRLATELQVNTADNVGGAGDDDNDCGRNDDDDDNDVVGSFDLN